jgi:hypothetical protein
MRSWSFGDSLSAWLPTNRIVGLLKLKVRKILDTTSDILTYFVTGIGGIALNVFSNWFYDKIKNNPDKNTVINGNVINAKTVNITNIIQIISNDKKDK